MVARTSCTAPRFRESCCDVSTKRSDGRFDRWTRASRDAFVDATAGLSGTAERGLFGFHSFCSAGCVLEPFTLHHERHVSLRLGQTAFAGLPANLSVVVRIHALDDVRRQQDQILDEGGRIGR